MKNFILLCSFLFLLSSCSFQDSLKESSAQSPSSATNVTLDTNTSPDTVTALRGTHSKNANTQNAAQREKIITRAFSQKNVTYTFDHCSYYRCKQASSNDEPNNAIMPPEGFLFLELDSLPKDYLLTVKQGNVYSYQVSTKKITPFSVNTTNKQLSLLPTQGLFSIEAYDTKGVYFLGLFTFEKSNSICAECTHTHSTQMKEGYLYDSRKDTLHSLAVTPFTNIDLSHSVFKYNAQEQVITTWNYINRNIYRGPIGEPAIHQAPVENFHIKTSKQTKLIPELQNTQEPQYIVPSKEQVVYFIFGKANSSISASLRPMTITTLLVKNLYRDDSLSYTISQAAQKTLRSFEDMNKKNNIAVNFMYGFAEADISSTSITLHGLDADLILLIEGQNISKAEVITKDNSHLWW